MQLLRWNVYKIYCLPQHSVCSAWLRPARISTYGGKLAVTESLMQCAWMKCYSADKNIWPRGVRKKAKVSYIYSSCQIKVFLLFAMHCCAVQGHLKTSSMDDSNKESRSILTHCLYLKMFWAQLWLHYTYSVV